MSTFKKTFWGTYNFFSKMETGPNMLAKWEHSVVGLQYSVEYFYRALETVIRELQIPRLKIQYYTYSEGGLLSARRLYQRIRRKDIYIDICAAPLGTTFFVSYRVFQKRSFFGNLLSSVPVAHDFVDIARTKSYYEEDVLNQLQKVIQDSIMKVLNDITNVKGRRNYKQ